MPRSVIVLGINQRPDEPGKQLVGFILRQRTLRRHGIKIDDFGNHLVVSRDGVKGTVGIKHFLDNLPCISLVKANHNEFPFFLAVVCVFISAVFVVDYIEKSHIGLCVVIPVTDPRHSASPQGVMKNAVSVGLAEIAAGIIIIGAVYDRVEILSDPRQGIHRADGLDVKTVFNHINTPIHPLIR